MFWALVFCERLKQHSLLDDLLDFVMLPFAPKSSGAHLNGFSHEEMLLRNVR